MPTSPALPDTITHHTHAREQTDTHDATSPTQHNTTSASWRVSPKTAHTNKPHSHAAYKHTSPTCPHDVPHSRNHCTLPKHHCTHTAARTPHTARHTAPTTAPATPHDAHRKAHPVTHASSAPHSPKIRQAAQRRRDAARELVAPQLQLPAGHTNSHRVTPWHPTLTPNAARRPQRISAHRFVSIKSTHAQHRVRATPQPTHPDSPQVPDGAVILPDKPATQRRSRKSQHHDSDAKHVQTGARHTTTTTTPTTTQHSSCEQRANAASTHMQNRNTTTLKPTRRVDTKPRASQTSTHKQQQQQQQQRRRSVGGRRRDENARAVRRIITQHHSRFSNSHSSPPLLCVRLLPLTAAATE
jgi:hypothetical protein